MNCTQVFKCGTALALALTVVAQEPSKPVIATIKELPSEPILAGTCVSSTAGYLEKGGRTQLTEEEIGNAVFGALKEGYIVTLYPQSKRGVFVNFECPDRASAKPAKVP
jgi:hypothetical protein